MPVMSRGFDRNRWIRGGKSDSEDRHRVDVFEREENAALRSTEVHGLLVHQRIGTWRLQSGSGHRNAFRRRVEERLILGAPFGGGRELVQIQVPRQHGHHDACAVVGDAVLRRAARAPLGRCGDHPRQPVGAAFGHRLHRRRAAGAIGLAGIVDEAVVLHARREIRRGQYDLLQLGAGPGRRSCDGVRAGGDGRDHDNCQRRRPHVPPEHECKATHAAR